MSEYFANGSLHYQDGEWRDDNGDVVEIEQVRHSEWEIVKGVLTPGGDPLKRCPYCKSEESEHLDGVEHPSNWMYCPVCGTKMGGNKNLIKRKDMSRCRKCVYEMTCFKDRDFEGTCPSYKRDAPDGGYYG